MHQPRAGFRAGSDAILLAASVPARGGDDILDLGCGVGAVMYAVATRVPDLRLTGVEVDADTVSLAARNGDAQVIHSSIFDLPVALRTRQFAHVATNPPYFRAADGSPSASAKREQGLREDQPGGLTRWVQVACKRVAPKGTCSVIVRADRLADVLAPMAVALGRLRVLPIAARPGDDAKRVIVQGTQGARGPLRLLSPFVLHDADGGYLPGADSVLRNAAALPLT
ncbi:MAG: methyltransferase [Pseudomonadota bacterium]